MSLRLYESIYIFSPQVTSEKIDSVIKQVEGMIKEHEGVLLRTEKWGLKKLAYLVKKFSEGYYLYFLYDAKPGTAKVIESKLKFDEDLIRFLSVQVEKARQEDARRKAREKPQLPEEKPAPAAAPVHESIKERLSKVGLTAEDEEERGQEDRKAGEEEMESIAEKEPYEIEDSEGPEESKEI